MQVAWELIIKAPRRLAYAPKNPPTNSNTRRVVGATDLLPLSEHQSDHYPVPMDAVETCQICKVNARRQGELFKDLPKPVMNYAACNVYLYLKRDRNCFKEWYTTA
jgi:hypothetical protein